MHSVLFVATPESGNSGTAWQEFLKDVSRSTGSGAAVQRLAENVWLFELRNDFAVFAGMIVAAERYQVGYGILPLEHEPEWLPAGSGPKTISAQNARNP